MAKTRGKVRGGRGGKRGARRAPRARVVDAGLFYALRASVELLLQLVTEPSRLNSEKSKALVSKLNVWLEAAKEWKNSEGSSDVRVREHEPEGRQLQRGLAPGEGQSPPGGKGARHTIVVRKAGRPPQWEADQLELPKVVVNEDGT